MTEELIQTLILNLPNFVGFVVLAYVLTRTNTKLTDTIIEMARSCDCDKKPDAEQPEKLPGS